jgi:hypothetical protein
LIDAFDPRLVLIFVHLSLTVACGQNALDQLCASLARHFDVQMDEDRIWRGYNEYAIR